MIKDKFIEFINSLGFILYETVNSDGDFIKYYKLLNCIIRIEISCYSNEDIRVFFTTNEFKDTYIWEFYYDSGDMFECIITSILNDPEVKIALRSKKLNKLLNR